MKDERLPCRGRRMRYRLVRHPRSLSVGLRKNSLSPPVGDGRSPALTTAPTLGSLLDHITSPPHQKIWLPLLPLLLSPFPSSLHLLPTTFPLAEQTMPIDMLAKASFLEASRSCLIFQADYLVCLSNHLCSARTALLSGRARSGNARSGRRRNAPSHPEALAGLLSRHGEVRMPAPTPSRSSR